MAYALIEKGPSASFAADDPFRAGAVDAASADIVVCLGGAATRDTSKQAVVVELGTRFLADFAGLDGAGDNANIVGFARYRNGDDVASNLVELVKAGWTSEEAVAAARAMFEEAGLEVVVCTDQAGRIIDRLVRPKYNAALRFLDEGLATQADMDKTCRMGLGYPDGPLERVMRGGLANHFEVTQALFEVNGTPAYAPPRAAVVAARSKDALK